jgi:acylphosphatase
METRRCVVQGRVQGVGFRWFVSRNARELGVRGSVRNRSDGSVEAVLQADIVEAVDRLVDRIRVGPPAARVDALECAPLDAAARYARFEVTG